MIEFAGLALPFVNRDLAFAASGDSVLDRDHPGRFVADGRALIFVYEVVSPTVVIVTALRSE